MVIAAYATMPIVPEVKNLRATLERQTSRDFAAAGLQGGRRFGDAAGREAGTRFRSRFSHVAKEAFAPVAGLLAGAGIVELFKGTIDQAREAAAAGRQTNAVIASTGGVAHVSSKGVTELADALSRKVGIDEEAIHSSENLLLTFRNIRNEAGAGNDVFDQTAAAVLNVATALKRDLASTSIQVGKALNDPIRGLTALTRIGISFDAQQRSQIKTLVQSGNVIGAQKLILAELSKQFGGAAAAGHDAVDRLGVEFKKLERDAGTAAIPAVEGLAKGLESAIPIIERGGSAAHTAGHEYGQLPQPVKDAAKAFLALKAAQAVGLTGFLGSGLTGLRTGLSQIQTRAQNAASAFRTVRSDLLIAGKAGTEFSGSGTRVAASLEAIRAASFGAGAGISRGLRGALNLVGGPWGAAFIAGTAIVAHFWAEHQKAKQRVQDFTATLDKETGALTENSREFAVKQLLDDGVLKSAQRLGLSLTTVTDAALGQWQAMATLNAVMASKGQLDTQAAADAIKVKSAIDSSNSVVGQGVANQKLFAAALGDTGVSADGVVTSTGQAATATGTYASELDKAKKAVRDLLDVENKRRNSNLTSRQDRLALVEQLQAAREQAAKGAGNNVGIKTAQVAAQSAQLAYTKAVKAHGAASAQAKIAGERLAIAQDKLAAASSAAGKTLDINTKAGQANQQALFDLASQWNNSANSVKNAKGAFADFRKQFVNIAISMGDSRSQAEKLADSILNVPRRVDTHVSTPGMKQALRDLAALRAELRAIHNFKGERFVFSVQATKNRASVADAQAHATGGMISGPGSGTSDSVLMWGSNGEFMQRKAAVDYYGVDFMRAVNALQVPRYATGGPIGPVAPSSSTVPLGTEIRGILSIDRDGHVFLSGVARAEVAAAARTRAGNRRRSASDGVRRP